MTMRKRELLDQIESMANEVDSETMYLKHHDQELLRYAQGRLVALKLVHEMVDELDD